MFNQSYYNTERNGYDNMDLSDKPNQLPDSLYKWTKISSLKIDIFVLKMMMKSGLEFFYFKIHRALSELLLPSAKKSAQKG